MSPRDLHAAHTPATPTGSGVLSLPTELLSQSCRRVGIASLAVASLWAFGLLLANAVTRFVDTPMLMSDRPWPMPGNAIAGVGLVLSVAMMFVAARLHHRPQLLLDVGLGFEVVTAFLIGLLQMWVPTAPHGLSWIAIVILVYPSIAPNTPRKIFIASVLAASMDPVGLAIAKLRGVEIGMGAAEAVFAFAPTYFTAALAVLPAKIIRGLGRQVRQARQLGSYRLGDRLGAGGMGEVFHAEHRLLARPAAIKLIRLEVLGASSPDQQRVAVERFKREAQAAATLRSPHTIELYDFGIAEDGAFYYVMELLDGAGFEELVNRFGPVRPERAAHLARQACESLAEAHAKGLIHRDIKPSNLHTCRMGVSVDFVKVLDFGLVKADQSREQTMLTQPHMTTGTPAFMAPELAMGERTADRQVDVYALGCVLYWLVTGRLVFEADNPIKMMHRHISDAPEPPSRHSELAIPPAFDELVLQCLAKAPDDRPAGAEEVGRRLDALDFPERWTSERARRWWDTHLPEGPERAPCDKGELAPVISAV
jgi:serine/threonine-protein kinase